MSVQELKEQLIEQIGQIEDEDVLLQMAELAKGDGLFDFSESEWAQVEKGLADADAGRMLNVEEFKSYLDQCAGLSKSQIRPPFN